MNSDMILNRVQRKIERHKKEEFIYPLYNSYCFSNIPTLILSLFGIHQDNNPLWEILEYAKVNPKNYKKIILLLLDGLGFNQWLQEAVNYNFFKKVKNHGIVVPITTIFHLRQLPH